MKIKKNSEILAFQKIRDFEFCRKSEPRYTHQIRRGDFGLSRQIRKKVKRDVLKEFEKYKRREESREREKFLRSMGSYIKKNQSHANLDRSLKRKEWKEDSSLDMMKSLKSLKNMGKFSFTSNSGKIGKISRKPSRKHLEAKKMRAKKKRGGSLSSYIAAIGDTLERSKDSHKRDFSLYLKNRHGGGHRRHQSMMGSKGINLKKEDYFETKFLERRLEFASNFRAIRRKFNLS
jgi:hypothetical protein